MRIRWYVPAAVAGIVTIGAAYVAFTSGGPAAAQNASTSERSPADGRPRVEVITPTPGGLEHTSKQPGSVHAFEEADLFAKVSGYMKSQYVDIGDHVLEGQVLAEIDMPELVKEVKRDVAALSQAQAQVVQAKARVATADADWQAAMAVIKQSEADLGKAQATRNFREKQYARIKALFQLNSVDERLVDEKEDEREAARSAERSAEAAVATSKAQAAAAGAKIDQAKADVAEAESKVQVTEAELEKTRVLLDYAKIVSPYHGVITARNFHPGDFIRAADQGAQQPLLTVQKTDLMRVVVQVPDQDVPFTNPGDLAVVEIDALPGVKFTGKVSRIASAEDSHTRTMRTEVDLPNPDGVLREGMYGRVTITLERPRQSLTIPASCLVGQSRDSLGSVYVVRDGKTYRTQVKLGGDNGLLVEVLSGLGSNDRVVAKYNGAIGDGVPAEVVGQ